MVLKKYFNDCIVKKLDQRLIIMIINDKNTFLLIMGIEKYKFSIVNAFCSLKEKKKIIILDFLLL